MEYTNDIRHKRGRFLDQIYSWVGEIKLISSTKQSNSDHPCIVAKVMTNNIVRSKPRYIFDKSKVLEMNFSTNIN